MPYVARYADRVIADLRAVAGAAAVLVVTADVAARAAQFPPYPG
jgi:hypothetical protein